MCGERAKEEESNKKRQRQKRKSQIERDGKFKDV